MVYSTEGLPLQGITGGQNLRRVDFILKETRYSQCFYIEVSANGEQALERTPKLSSSYSC